MKTDASIHAYLAEIGRRGGKKSRRRLSATEARRMVAVREARKAFREHRVDCFWSFRDMEKEINAENALWVAKELSRNGDRKAWLAARKIRELLCR
jgi:hypothetical protein